MPLTNSAGPKNELELKPSFESKTDIFNVFIMTLDQKLRSEASPRPEESEAPRGSLKSRSWKSRIRSFNPRW